MFDTYSEIYDTRGQSYHLAMERWPQARAEEFEALVDLAALNGSSPTILDIPSGGGYLEGYLPAEAHLISVDPAPSFLKSGEHKGSRDVICAPHENIPLADESADYIFSLAGLHHLKRDEQAAAFREWARLLRPGGAMVVGDGLKGTSTPRFLDGVVGKYNSMGHRGFYLSQETLAMVEQAGLSVVSAGEKHYGWNFKTRSEMLAFCRILFSMDKAPSDEVLCNEIVNTVGFKEGEGFCRMAWSLFFIRAEKRGDLSTV